MKNVSSQVLQLLGMMLAAALTVGGHAARAAPLQYPDLQNIIPPADMSIVQNGSVREFRYTHDIYNAGPGPLEIQPIYSNTSGNYQGFQHIYSLASGNWSLDITTRVAGAFVFHAVHGHFHFPLATFGLYSIATDGGVGAPVALSPKDGFCIANSYLYNPNVPNVGAFLNHGSCTDPTSLRGLSVGYVDEYDYRDPGQSIPIDGLPDGTYWFRAVADPNNYLAEGDESNNITDVKVRITGNVVQTFETASADSTPPVIDMISPLEGEFVSGTITLMSSTPTPGVVGVQYLLDGLPLGGVVTNGPDYSILWNTATVADGAHWLAVQTTDAAGRTGASPVVAVTVANVAPPPPAGDLAIDRSFSQDGNGSVTNAVSTSTSNQLLLAFVSADGPGSGTPQTATVSGGGLTWTLVRRANSQSGTSEIWMATAANQLVATPVTSNLAHSNYPQSMTVVVFDGAGGVGASAAASAASGAPQLQYTTTRDGSWGFGVGNDWDRAVARTLASGQTMIHQYLAPVGDTMWVQSQSAPVANAGAIANISVVAPTNDRWNLAAVEVLPATTPAPDITPPTVEINNPADGSTVSGIVTIAATAADTGGVGDVQFYVDNTPLGQPVTTPPFMMNWDTTEESGAKTLTASATDLAQNTGDSAPVNVTVDNSLPPPDPIGIDAMVFRDSKGILTTPSFSTATPGDLLVAFVAYDGPKTGIQTAIVSGGGLTWSLVKRSNSQHGTAEIWSARATGLLSSKTVRANPGVGSYHGSLTVVAFTNAVGTGIAGASGAPTGQPNIYLPGIATGNWVWAVGNDWDNAIARTPVSGQVIVHQRLAPVGDTFWVQRTSTPSAIPGIVEIRNTAPTTDQWNYAAVEIVATH